jgi:5-formyltetrahydrofolate cyclo-ligase
MVENFDGCLMIVPAIQFDLQGYRLGYGKGYYDRYMSRFTGVSAGLCYIEELRRHMYHGRFDKPVDIIVTDKCIRTCKK